MRIKLLSVLLGLCLLATACGGREVSQQETQPVPLKGRYVEKELDFPKFSNVVAFTQVSPDTFYVLGEVAEKRYEMWSSDDGGVSWKQEDRPGLEGRYIASAAFDVDGSAYVNYVIEEGGPESPAVFSGAYMDASGWQELEDIAGLDEHNTGISLLGNQMFFNKYFEGQLLDLETGKVVNFEIEGMLWFGNYTLYDNTLAVYENGGIALYDIATGERTSRIEYASAMDGMPCIAVQEDRTGFYYCDTSGLYRISVDGAITEQIMEGTVATIGLPSAYVQKLAVSGDGSFLVLCSSSGSWQLLQYAYDETVPREPAEEMHVYSLREDNFIRQAIVMYHKNNPDRMIRYSTGLTEDGGATVDDAIRALSTELLAGKGPDVLVLDGLPVDSYRRHGVLLDLSEGLGGLLDELVPGAVGAFNGEDGLRAIPARASLPLVAGIGVEDIHDFGSFADYLEGQPLPRSGITAETVIEEFYPICANRWFLENGGVDRDRMTEDLAQLARIVEISDTAVYNERIGMGLFSQPIWWSAQETAIMSGQLKHMEAVANVFSAIDVRGDGIVKTFPSDGGILIPSTILGVNAAGGQTDAAMDFVRQTLSQPVQKYSLSNGIAVHRGALAEASAVKNPGETLMVNGSGFQDIELHATLEIIWPTEERMASAIELICGARPGGYVDEATRQILLDETADLFAGQRTVEDTVESLVQQVQRRLEELA